MGNANPPRDAARAAGEKFYMPLRPCVNGHLSLRRTTTSHCSECIAAYAAKHYSTHSVERNAKLRAERAVHRKPKPVKTTTAKPAITVQLDGDTLSLKDAATKLGIKVQVIHNRAHARKHTHQEVVEFYRVKRDTPRDELRTPTGRRRTLRQPRDKLAPKHYLENTELLAELEISRRRNRATDRLATMLMDMADRYFRRRNLINYSYRDEMQEEGLMAMLAAWPRFDPEKSNNPFAYFTSCMYHAAIHILKRERRDRDMMQDQRDLMSDLLEQEAPGSQSRKR